MLLSSDLIFLVNGVRSSHHYNIVSPVMEEGLLIGIAIVAILIVLGIIFGTDRLIGYSFIFAGILTSIISLIKYRHTT